MMSHQRKLALLAVLFLSISVVARQQEPTVKLESSLVLVDAIVLSKKTNAIVADLKREDFTLLEDKKKQEITHFSREELPLSVMLLVDVSGSVQPIIDEIQQAALDALAQLKPQDKVGLMIFANKPKLVAELTSDRTVIADKLDNIWSETADVGFATFINLGVYEAARYLRKKTEPTERRAIIMITDDMDTAGLARWSGGPPRDVVARELYEGGTTLCGIIVGFAKGAMTAVNMGTTAAITAVNPAVGAMLIALKLFRRLSPVTGSAKFYAEQTGGVVISAKYDEVAKTFVEMMGLLRTRYTLGYSPADLTPDGRVRQIVLTVSDHVKKQKGEVKVLARRGYYVRRQTGLGDRIK